MLVVSKLERRVLNHVGDRLEVLRNEHVEGVVLEAFHNLSDFVSLTHGRVDEAAEVDDIFNVGGKVFARILGAATQALFGAELAHSGSAEYLCEARLKRRSVRNVNFVVAKP